MAQGLLLPLPSGAPPAPSPELALVLSGALHSSRNLVMAMRGYAELIRKRDDAVDRHAEWADKIIHQLDRLNELYTRVSALSAPPSAWRPVAVELLLRGAETQASQRFAGGRSDVGMRLRVAGAACLHGDAQELTRSLSAVLENALEASPAGAAIAVEAVADAAGRLHLAVEDQGSGLTPTQLERAGQPFYTTKPDRLGLGLFLARSILGRYGLGLTIENRAVGGARVVITAVALATTPATFASAGTSDLQGGTQ